MIYKLLDTHDGNKSLEVRIVDSEDIEFTINEHIQHSTEITSTTIDKQDLYTLIGVLHSIQKQLN